jgi:steroid delta-isomerase-like uncharacterized protein
MRIFHYVYYKPITKEEDMRNSITKFSANVSILMMLALLMSCQPNVEEGVPAEQVLVEKWIKAYNEGDLEAFDEIISADFEQKIYGLPDVNGLEGYKEYISMIHTAYPDIETTIDDMVVGDHKVAILATARGTHEGPLRGIPASGNKVEISYIGIFHIENGKIAKSWAALDKYDYLQQLGVIPKEEPY